MTDTQNLKNPTTLYYHDDFDLQPQEKPGIQAKMHPLPDCGEKSYQGHGRLKGRKALVTGGDSGIGRAAAIAYAREGADVAINYLPEEQEDAEAVKKLIEEAGQKAVLIPGDISNESFCKELIEKAIKELDGIDILAMVAGFQQFNKDLTTLPSEQLIHTFAVNVFAMFWITQAALPHLKPGSSIITTSSVQAYQPSEILLDYAASKCAIVGFTKALAKQIAKKGIRVNCVAPGPIWTPLQICGGQDPEKIPQFGQETPLKRAGEPAELASVYVLLASEESTYTTAMVYGVTGGLLLM